METDAFTPSPTIHTLWRNNCTKQLLPISSRLAAFGNDGSWEATNCRSPSACHPSGSKHSSAPHHPEDQDVWQPLTFRAASTPPVANILLLQIFRGWPLSSMDLKCAQQGPMCCWLLLQSLNGWHCSLGLTWKQILQCGVHRKIPGFVSCHWKWLWFFFAHITQGHRSHVPYYKEVGQGPWASFEDLRDEKSPRGQL